MRQNNRKQNIKKERIIMIASSAFVMAALTMTGVYMKENSAQNQDDGYSIDFTGIESQAEDGIQEAGDAQKPHNAVTYPQGDDAMQEIPEDDLDYLPMEEAGSSLIQIPGLTDGVRSEADVASDEQLAMLEEQKATEKQPEEKDDKPQESGAAATEPIREQTPPAVEQPVLEQIAPEQPALEQPVLEQSVLAEEQPVWDAQDVRTLAFSSDQGLVRPVSGDILIPYSMDRTVYFTTLDQYKYNPATVYRVEEGTQVMACAEGRVASVFRNEEIGQAVTLDLGNGYQVVYGQLQALNVAEGDYVNPGQIIGSVAAPTIYYSLEGSNLYFLLEQDGAALDPQNLYF
ncbi:stage II sporulation protein Q [Lachnospiraceae bacterium]|nr:peptidoglycan DD-metalloendopeptidase family protein [Acetatifactor sp.]GFH94585.1 stage II sporulation protein Q [Lachnospiraceae bacterium]